MARRTDVEQHYITWRSKLPVNTDKRIIERRYKRSATEFPVRINGRIIRKAVRVNIALINMSVEKREAFWNWLYIDYEFKGQYTTLLGWGNSELEDYACFIFSVAEDALFAKMMWT